MLALWLSLVGVVDTTGNVRVALTPAETLAVTSSGEGSAVVIIPGLAGSAFGFRLLSPLLVAAGHRVVIVEPLGMGTSSRPPRADYSLEAQAGRIAAVLDTLAIRGALVMGHSLGGSIALRLTLARPDLVRGVVLIEGGVAEQAATAGLRHMMLFAPWVKMLGGEALFRKQMKKSLAKSSADTLWITDAIIAGYTQGAEENLDLTLKGYLQMVDARDENRLATRLGLIRLPVLLVLGAVPHQGGPDAKEVDLLSTGLPIFSIQLVARAGHHIQEEQPGALADVIVAFDSPRH